MENYILYDGEDCTVELDWRVKYYVDNIYIPNTKPSKDFIQNVLIPIMDDLEKKGLKKKEMKVKFCGQAPIFQYEKYAIFSSPFDIFETAQSIIVNKFNITENISEIREELLEKYDYLLEDGETFIPLIFQDIKKTYGISGLFIYLTEKEAIVMPWVYVEDK